MRRGVRSHVRYADLEGHLTSAGMALQYYPVDIPIRTRLVLLLAIVMAGAFSFFRRRELLFPPIRFIPPRCFRVRKTPQSLCPVPLVLSPEEASFGGKRFGAFRSRGGRQYTPYERSTPGTSRLERGHAFSSFVALSGNSFCPGILLRRGSVLSAVSILPRGWVFLSRLSPVRPPAV